MKQFHIGHFTVSLRLKIFTGYILLFILLCIVISLVWLEQHKIEVINDSEQLILHKRNALNRTFEKLLDFSLSDELLLLRDSNRFNEYQIKRKAATNVLNDLKLYYSTDVQRLQIDGIASIYWKRRYY